LHKVFPFRAPPGCVCWNGELGGRRAAVKAAPLQLARITFFHVKVVWHGGERASVPGMPQGECGRAMM
jgi:hypothetical protein